MARAIAPHLPPPGAVAAGRVRPVLLPLHDEHAGAADPAAGGGGPGNGGGRKAAAAERAMRADVVVCERAPVA